MLRLIQPYDLMVCRHPEHNPPTMIVLQPRMYEHTCPGCGQAQQFSVERRHYLAGTQSGRVSSDNRDFLGPPEWCV